MSVKNLILNVPLQLVQANISNTNNIARIIMIGNTEYLLEFFSPINISFSIAFSILFSAFLTTVCLALTRYTINTAKDNTKIAILYQIPTLSFVIDNCSFITPVIL